MSRLLTLMSLSAWLLGACGTEEEPAPVTLEITGSLERTAEDPKAWVGTEEVRVLDASGAVLCEQVVALSAREILQSCVGCVVTMKVEPADGACPLAEVNGSAADRYLGLGPASASGEAWLDLAVEATGPWSHFARASFEDGVLVYEELSDLPDADPAAFHPSPGTGIGG
ncbi:MAG: hypothetical protein H6738_10040 [Alphaproteobacteria bacterium]|nr:hypothetical protein [Alphaproteobacteria bacterium]